MRRFKSWLPRVFALLLGALPRTVALVPGSLINTPESNGGNATPALTMTTLAAGGSFSRGDPTDPVLRLVTADQGNEVRYRVREQLMGIDLPSDAIGRTSQVRGTIAVDSLGRVLAKESQFTIQVGSLTSDKDRRDGYVRSRLLETGQYPTVVFQPTRIQGLSLPLPDSGRRPVTMAGQLTIKGVTRLAIWQMNAIFGPGQVSGTATTGFTFDDFELAKPRVPVVLSVADSIHLEYDFLARVADSATAAQAQ